jgi:hypothetical protein
MKLIDLANKYSEIAYPIITERYSANCCIAATQVSREVFSYFGFETGHLCTSVVIVNEKMMVRSRGRDDLPDEAESSQWADEGCYSVIIGKVGQGHERENDKIQTHLVATVSNGHNEPLVIDASIKQAQRPQHDILLPNALVFPARELIEEGQQLMRIEARHPTCQGNPTTSVYYLRREDQDDYKTSPDWLTRRWEKVAAKLIRELRKDID